MTKARIVIKKMNAEQTYEQLEAAHLGVIRAIDELLLSDLAVANCPDHLELAAELLIAVQKSNSLRDSRHRIQPLLRAIAVQAETATRLLESAATSYLGRILSTQVSDAGYTFEGAPEKLFNGLSLAMEG